MSEKMAVSKISITMHTPNGESVTFEREGWGEVEEFVFDEERKALQGDSVSDPGGPVLRQRLKLDVRWKL